MAALEKVKIDSRSKQICGSGFRYHNSEFKSPQYKYIIISNFLDVGKLILSNSLDWKNPKDVFLAILMRLFFAYPDFPDVLESMRSALYMNTNFDAFFDKALEED